jgi:hypothetical protein
MGHVATIETIPGYVRLERAAEIIGVSHAQVWRYIDAQQLDALKIGKTYLVRETDAKNFQRPPRGNPDFLRKKAV